MISASIKGLAARPLIKCRLCTITHIHAYQLTPDVGAASAVYDDDDYDGNRRDYNDDNYETTTMMMR